MSNCVVPLHSLYRTAIMMVIPLMLIIIVYLFRCLLRGLRMLGAAKLDQLSWWRFAMCQWQLLLFGFMGICSNIFKLVDCIHWGDRYVLRWAPYFWCYESTHLYISVFAILLAFFMIIVLPLCIVKFLMSLRHRLAQLKGDVMKQHEEEGEQQEETNSNESNHDQLTRRKLQKDSLQLQPSPTLKSETRMSVKSNALQLFQKVHKKNVRTLAKLARTSLQKSASMQNLMDTPLTKSDTLLLSHSILFISYTDSFFYYETLWLMRRALIAFVHAIWSHGVANVSTGLILAIEMFFHSCYDVFAVQETKRLHKLICLSLLSLLFLQSTENIRFALHVFLTWLFILLPLVYAVARYPMFQTLWRRCCKCNCARGDVIMKRVERKTESDSAHNSISDLSLDEIKVSAVAAPYFSSDAYRRSIIATENTDHQQPSTSRASPELPSASPPSIAVAPNEVELALIDAAVPSSPSFVPISLSTVTSAPSSPVIAASQPLTTPRKVRMHF